MPQRLTSGTARSAAWNEPEDEGSWEARARANLAQQAAMFAALECAVLPTYTATASCAPVTPLVKPTAAPLGDDNCNPPPTPLLALPEPPCESSTNGCAARTVAAVDDVFTALPVSTYGRKRRVPAPPPAPTSYCAPAPLTVTPTLLLPLPEWALHDASTGSMPPPSPPPPLKKHRSHATLAFGATLQQRRPPAPPLPPAPQSLPPHARPAGAPTILLPSAQSQQSQQQLDGIRRYFETEIDPLLVPEAEKCSWVYVDAAPSAAVVDARLREVHPTVAKHYDAYFASLAADGLLDNATAARGPSIADASSLSRPQHLALLFETPVA